MISVKKGCLVSLNDLIITGWPINSQTSLIIILIKSMKSGSSSSSVGDIMLLLGNGGNNDPPHTISLGNMFLAPNPPACMHNNDTWLKLTHFIIFSSFPWPLKSNKIYARIYSSKSSISLFLWVIKKLTKSQLDLWPRWLQARLASEVCN